MPADDGFQRFFVSVDHCRKIPYGTKFKKNSRVTKREPSGILICQGLLEGTPSSLFDGERNSLQWEDEFYPLFHDWSHNIKFLHVAQLTTCKNLFLRVFFVSNFKVANTDARRCSPKSKSTKIQR